MYLESGHVTYGMTPSTILAALRFSSLSEDRQSNCFRASMTVEARSIESCDLDAAPLIQPIQNRLKIAKDDYFTAILRPLHTK
jgi:hypothetical protein